MKVCIIAEGSYPYITGGVSSWVHSLIQSMPEHDFVIYAIAAQERSKGKYKYKVPANVVHIQEVFLDAYLREQGQWGTNYKTNEEQQKSFINLLGGEDLVDWPEVFAILRNKKFRSAIDFLMSKDYFDLLEQLCLKYYPQVPFTEMFWTVRSMVLPLFQIIRQPVPEADIYHAVSTGYAGIIGSLGKQLYHKPLIITEHGIYSREREEEIIKAVWVKGYFKDVWIHYFYTLSKCAYQYADKVVTLFHRNKEIQLELGCAAEKIEIVPNGVKLELFADIPLKSPDDKEVLIGAFVRVVPIKDIKTLIHSFALVKEEIPEAKLYIMGPNEEDEEYYEECVQLVKALHLEDVCFTGEIQVREYIGKMDVLVLTSISEGQPLVILEGMAAAKPFVTTDVGSCKELLLGGPDDELGEAGIVVSVMHYEQIAKAIIQLCRNEKRRIQMGEIGKRRASNGYTHKQFIDAYRSIYQACGV